MGADYIERHITIDRSLWGTNQSESIEPQGMSTLSGILKKSSHFLWKWKEKKISSVEKKMLKKFKYW